MRSRMLRFGDFSSGPNPPLLHLPPIRSPPSASLIDSGPDPPLRHSTRTVPSAPRPAPFPAFHARVLTDTTIIPLSVMGSRGDGGR